MNLKDSWWNKLVLTGEEAVADIGTVAVVPGTDGAPALASQRQGRICATTAAREVTGK